MVPVAPTGTDTDTVCAFMEVVEGQRNQHRQPNTDESEASINRVGTSAAGDAPGTLRVFLHEENKDIAGFDGLPNVISKPDCVDEAGGKWRESLELPFEHIMAFEQNDPNNPSFEEVCFL